ncbi:transcription factor bHLH96-like isoform X2 [Hordeum vulgare subsp. vulgare]|uniref:transcription factor bHLH96-like isoform X2 n=1 Tax=Hordeum vulgare subsp. vulgare TaxID=112509 RepID=UPI001D1A3DBE|nr:transcription factor bHLH96-like isoform X2 [Hordeum vulgare subsp. vulgare]
MALEAVVLAQGHFGYGLQAPGLAPWCDMLGAGGFLEDDWDQQLLAAPVAPNAEDQWEPVSSWDQSEASSEGKAAAPPEPATAAAATGRRKRRRAKIVKNKEEVESQRRTHIAVERNRRRQMNEYLAALRLIMPQSYAQRGDQASIVGGAINYVKELEQLLQSLEVQKSVKNRTGRSPFASSFTFPQYSASCNITQATTASDAGSGADSSGIKSEAGVADIEVTMVEGHASLKVLARRRPKQLLRLVAGLQQLRIPALHLNVTTVDAMVLYSFSLKVMETNRRIERGSQRRRGGGWIQAGLCGGYCGRCA